METDHRMSARVLRRIREELDERDISQRDLAERLSHVTGEPWTQSRIGKVLTGYVELKVDDAAVIVGVLGLTLSEAVRDRGVEFYAEMTPSEMRMFTVYQQRPPAVQHAIQTLLGIGPPSTPKMKLSQDDLPKRRKSGRPMNSELAKRRA